MRNNDFYVLWRSSLTVKKHNQILFLGLLFLLQAATDVLGVSAIVPLIAVISDNRLIYENFYLNWLYSNLGFNEAIHFIFFLAFLLFSCVLASNVLRGLTAFKSYKFAYELEAQIGTKLIATYLAKDYLDIIKSNVAEFNKNILAESGQVVKGVFLASIQLVSQLILLLSLVVLLLFVDFKITLVVGICFLTFTYIMFVFSKPRLLAASQRRVLANAERFRSVKETFEGIKTVKHSNLEAYYINWFKSPANRYSKEQIFTATLAALPKFILETYAVGCILVLMFFLYSQQGGLVEALPIISVYAFAVYRLLPAVQQIFHCIATINAAQASLSVILDDTISELRDNAVQPYRKSRSSFKNIQMLDVSFSYPGGDGQKSVRSVSLSVPSNSMVGFVGRSGSGKTTTADILLGLIKPSSGKVLVDGLEVSASEQREPKILSSYVPQDIFVAHDSLIANIALGVAEEDVDVNHVISCVQSAQLEQFVEHELENGLATVLGDKGVRLSGGQRQRLGIARALYRDPNLIVMDEATNALDSITESDLLRSVQKLENKMSILMIAHRMETVRACDIIYVFDNGAVISSGTFGELMKTCEHFKKLVEAGS
ncbi:ABC transporter ATP-binding protein/permease [Alphaproteobacteria bacterium]|nr:ABC transporter ATP-binding protein/permease [Alphaproteobacteria bacterium]